MGLGAAALVAACSADGGGSSSFPSGSGGSGSGTHSTGNNTGGDVSSFVGANGSNGSTMTGGVGGGCVGTGSKAQQKPLDMFVMLDQSGSMSDPVQGGGSKWTAVTGALNAFVQQPNLGGVSMGLGYFGVPPGGGGPVCPQMCSTPADQAACGACGGTCLLGIVCAPPRGGGDSCNATDYAKPEIPIQPFPAVGSLITASLAVHMPSTSTPTSAALQGAEDYTKAWAVAHPTHISVVTFATDGDPTECDTNLANIDQIAAKALAGNPSILTFVIGVGPSLQALDGIAAAGGTMTAFHVDTNGNAGQQFLDAMNKIRGSLLSCSYLIPKPAMGQVDPTQVNVQYIPGAGGNPIVIPKVANKAACPASGLGWYYDNDATPTEIILCDATCTQLGMDAKAEVDIILGCGTVVK